MSGLKSIAPLCPASGGCSDLFSGGRRAASEHAPAFHVQYLVPVLVEHFPQVARHAHIGAFAHGFGLQHGALQPQGVARKHGFEPFDAFQSGRAQAGGLAQKVGHHQAHGHGAGVPAAGRQCAKHRGFGRFVVQVKGLGVELGGKSNDLFAGGRDACLLYTSDAADE